VFIWSGIATERLLDKFETFSAAGSWCVGLVGGGRSFLVFNFCKEKHFSIIYKVEY
jgi:hypothetical protein